MTDDAPIQLTADDIVDFLDAGGTGVLALAAGNEPYAVPVSYGFDAATGQFFFRLGTMDESEKTQFLERADRARFVVYDRRDGVWTSIVATGSLTTVDDEEITPEIAEVLRKSDPPLTELWPVADSELTFELYMLDTETLTGRAADVTD